MAVANGIDLINTMRENASLDYQDRIPLADRTNLAEIGNLLASTEFEPQRTEFLGLLQKVALTIFVQRAYNNPLKVLKKGRLPLGLTIEEIAIDICKGNAFDPTGANNMARVVPNAINFYHAHLLDETYSASVSRYQLITGFTSEANLNRMLENIINSMYNGFEVDEFIKMKEAYGTEIPNAYPVVITKPSTTLEAEAFVEKLREVVMGLTYPSTKYNPVGITSWTPTERQVLLIDYKVLAKVSVRVLASAFNRNDVDFTTRIIAIDDFGSLNETLKSATDNTGTSIDASCYAMLIDDEGALFYDLEMYMDRDHNGKGAFDTMHLHVKENFAVSQARNLVAFVNKSAYIELDTDDKEYWAIAVNSGVGSKMAKTNSIFATLIAQLKLYKDGQVVSTLSTQTNGLVFYYADGTSQAVNYSISSGSVSASAPSNFASKVVEKIVLKIS